MKPLPKLSIAPMAMRGYVLLQWQEGEGVTGLRSIQVPEHIGRGIVKLQNPDLVCPFCGETGFDGHGLYTHLSGNGLVLGGGCLKTVEVEAVQ